MYSFLVLGIIPGTNISISFQAWLIIMAVLPFVLMVVKLPHMRVLAFSKTTAAPRMPLPASQLHRRIRPAAR